MDRSLSKLWELVMDRETWHAVVYGIAKESDMTDWTELNGTELNIYKFWRIYLLVGYKLE